MTEPSLALDQESKRYPLSFTQEWFVTLDQGDDGGTFGRRFILVSAIRVSDPAHPIAEGARVITERLLQEPVYHDIPSGMVWNLNVEPSGKLHGSVLFNQDEFDESTVQGWAADLGHILTNAVRNPDQDWKIL